MTVLADQIESAIECFSANPAVGLIRGIRLQPVAYLPFSLGRPWTAAFPSSEWELPTHKRHSPPRWSKGRFPIGAVVHGTDWLSAARPIRPLAKCAESGCNLSLTCRSAHKRPRTAAFPFSECELREIRIGRYSTSLADAPFRISGRRGGCQKMATSILSRLPILRTS